MPNITVNPEWCKGCHICVEVCPRHVLAVDREVFRRGFHPVVVAKPEDCTTCLQCELLCPDLAITVAVSPRRAGSRGPNGEEGE
jgi:2-oxoglutarate ferredoxin oxidoreductase subunit delta